MSIQGVVRGNPHPPRVVLYGSPGVGKSTFGADSEKPIFVTTEDGVDNLPVEQFPKAESWTALLANVEKIVTEKHDHKTAVLDTLNGAIDAKAKEVCATMYGGQWASTKGQEGFLSWGQGWKATAEEIAPLLAALDRCRARGMMVVILAHTGLQTVRHPVDGEYQKFAPDMNPYVWARVCRWADIVVRADYDYVVIGEKNRKGRAKGTSTRRLFCEGSAAEDCKTRAGYELPPVMDLSYAAFAAELGKPTATLNEVRELWPILSAAEAAKALAWLGVQKIEDAPLQKARQLLNRLRERKAESVATETKEA